MNTLTFIVLIVFLYYVLNRIEMYTRPEKVLTEQEMDLSQYDEVAEVSMTHDLMQEIILKLNEEVSQKTGMCTYVIETTSIKKFIHKETGGIVLKCMFMIVKHGIPGFDFGFSVSADIVVVNPGPEIKIANLESTYRDGRSLKDIVEDTEKSIESRKSMINELNEYQKIKLEKDIKQYNNFMKSLKYKTEDKPEVKVLNLRTQPIDTIYPEDDTVFTKPTKKQEFVDYSLVKKSELESIVNKKLIEKQILSSQEMYGKNNSVLL